MLLSVDAKAAVRMFVSMHRAKLIEVLRSAVAPTQVMSAVTGQRRRFAPQSFGYLFSRTAHSHKKDSIAAHSPHCGECADVLWSVWVPAVQEKRYPQVARK